MNTKKRFCLMMCLVFVFSIILGSTSMAATTSTLTQIKMKGLGDEVFATVQYSNVNRSVSIRTANVKPHSYFDSTYASIKLEDSNGNVKYSKDYIGNQQYASEFKIFSVNYGDKLYISHAEHTRAEFYDDTNKNKLDIGPTEDYVNTEYILTATGLQKVEKYDYQIQMQGLGDQVFAYVDYNITDSELNVITKATSPHVYFNETYASIKIIDSSNNVKYYKDYVGNVLQQDSEDKIKISPDDEMQIYYAESNRLRFYDNVSDITDNTNLQPTADKIITSYVATSQGFKLLSDVVVDTKIIRNALVVGNTGSKIVDANDIKYMVNTLKQSDFDGEKINVNSLKNPTKAEFAEALKETFKTSNENSVNYLMISCHGSRGSYLALCTDGGIYGAQLKEMLDEIPGKFVLVVDACYSGSLVQSSDSLLQLSNNQLDFDMSSYNEKASEFSEDFVAEFESSPLLRNAEFTTPKYSVLCASTKDNVSYSGEYSFVFKAAADSSCINYCDQIKSSYYLADTNKDNKCTFAEVVQYCKNNIKWELASYSDNEDILCFQKPNTKLMYDYQICMAGLGDQIFATANYNTENKEFTLITNSLKPHSYFSNTYASIKVYTGTRGDVKLYKDYVGNVQQENSTETITVEPGDHISIYYAENTRLRFYDLNTLEKLDNLQPLKNRIYTEYEVTSKGIVRVDNIVQD